MNWKAKLVGVLLVAIWVISEHEENLFAIWFGIAGICMLVHYLTGGEAREEELENEG